MGKNKLDIVKRWIACLLIVSLSSVFYNNLINGHYHIQADGTKIYHAHPYSEGSKDTHSHSNLQYLFLQSIFELFSTFSYVSAFCFIIAVSTFTYRIVKIPFQQELVFSAFFNKAPPAIVLS
jgi:hypothetical protein